MMHPLRLVSLFAVALATALSPRGYAIESQRGVYQGLVLATLLFLLAVHAMIIAIGLGATVPVERVIPLGISLLLVAFGALVSKVTPNFFMGVRTPWTLTNPENWKATHRFASRVFVLGGVLLALACVAGASFWVVLAGLAAMGLLPVAYSLVLWLRVGRSA